MQPKLAELDKSLPAVELVRRINELISHEKKSKYTQQWQRYYERVSQKEEDEQIRTEPFFAPEVLLYHMGYRPWMDAGAGIHVSIGVLGTFIGLSAGLSRLNVMDPEALRVGIEGLVSGMKIAFYTSVLGVFLSIVWILIDRMISKWLESHIDWHAERLDYLLNIDDEELFLNRLEKVSRSQADHLKTLLTDALDQAMRPVVHVLEAQLEQQKQNSQSMTEQLVAQVAGGRDAADSCTVCTSDAADQPDNNPHLCKRWKRLRNGSAFGRKNRRLLRIKQTGYMYSFNRSAKKSKRCKNIINRLPKR